ncbi:MAG: transporter substrate-binding domain-containing protein [Proteobacteria bacterium]|nr:transporter substrate-binding domain-containing protein [Pseudomonadota bacterium]
MRSRWALAFCSAIAASLLTCEHASNDREGLLRVGTSGDYTPFSFAPAGGGLDGFDVALARAYAADRGLRLELVPFRWPDLLDDLAAGRFDAALSGITVRPERSVVGRFSVPLAESGALVLVPEAAALADLASLDRETVRIVVNEGGHLERVARGRFRRAQIRAIADNPGVLEALVEGRADAAVTDTLEAPRWMAGRALRALGPFTLDRKAALVRADRPELAADLDAWLLDREASGRLELLRREYLGVVSSRTAAPVSALFASIDERLSLMPFVADAKRAQGLPVVNSEVEERVIRSAVAGVRRAEVGTNAAPLAEEAVERLFRSLIDAAVAVQHATLATPADPGRQPLDLQEQIRPALLRIGERIAALLVRLPARLDADRVRQSAARELRNLRLQPDVRDGHSRAIADAVLGLRAAEGADQESSQHGEHDAGRIAQ